MHAIRTNTLAILAVGLLAGSAVGVAAQDGGSELVSTEGMTELYCVRVSEEVAAGSLNEAVVAEQVTIAVVPDAECAPSATLDALTDAESFGVYLMHVASMGAGLTEEMALLGPMADVLEAEGLAADPDTLAGYLVSIDNLIAIVENELAWLEDHPPRTCYAASHASASGYLERVAAALRDFATALPERDSEMLIQLVADTDLFMPPPDMLEQTCMPL